MGSEEDQLHAELQSLTSRAFEDVKLIRTLGAAGTQSQASDASGRVKACLTSIRRCLRDLELLAEEQETDEDTARVGKWVHDHKLQYERIRKGLSNAGLERKRNAERAWLEERRALLAGGAGVDHTVRSRQEAIKTSQNATDSLRKTREMMSQQVDLMGGNLEVLGTTNQDLGKTKDELQSQEGMFATSRGLLGTMSRHSFLDKLVLWGGLLLFTLVVVYVSQKRMMGITPEFVKTTVQGVWSTSLSSAGTLYEWAKTVHLSYPTQTQPTLDSKRFKPPDFQDLEDENRADQIPAGVDPDPGKGTCNGDGKCDWDESEKVTGQDMESLDIDSSGGESGQNLGGSGENLGESGENLGESGGNLGESEENLGESGKNLKEESGENLKEESGENLKEELERTLPEELKAVRDILGHVEENDGDGVALGDLETDGAQCVNGACAGDVHIESVAKADGDDAVDVGEGTDSVIENEDSNAVPETVADTLEQSKNEEGEEDEYADPDDDVDPPIASNVDVDADAERSPESAIESDDVNSVGEQNVELGNEEKDDEYADPDDQVDESIASNEDVDVDVEGSSESTTESEEISSMGEQNVELRNQEEDEYVDPDDESYDPTASSVDVGIERHTESSTGSEGSSSVGDQKVDGGNEQDDDGYVDPDDEIHEPIASDVNVDGHMEPETSSQDTPKDSQYSPENSDPVMDIDLERPATLEAADEDEYADPDDISEQPVGQENDVAADIGTQSGETDSRDGHVDVEVSEQPLEDVVGEPVEIESEHDQNQEDDVPEVEHPVTVDQETAADSERYTPPPVQDDDTVHDHHTESQYATEEVTGGENEYHSQQDDQSIDAPGIHADQEDPVQIDSDSVEDNEQHEGTMTDMESDSMGEVDTDGVNGNDVVNEGDVDDLADEHNADDFEDYGHPPAEVLSDSHVEMGEGIIDPAVGDHSDSDSVQDDGSGEMDWDGEGQETVPEDAVGESDQQGDESDPQFEELKNVEYNVV